MSITEQQVFIEVFSLGWENSPRANILRLTTVSLRAFLLALCLLAPILTPYATKKTLLTRATVGVGGNGSHPPEAFSHEPLLTFPRPLQAVNGSGAASNQPVQVGAWGDTASIGNTGVQVEIQTNSYNVSGQQDDAFWVGDVLTDGSFVQFGYLIMPPGYYCLNAHISESGTSCSGTGDNWGFADARWFWAYFPSAAVLDDWYYGFGPADSAGANSTWHLYSILPSASNNLSFMRDGVTVYSSDFPSATSTSPAHLVAEKASGPSLSQLGPVEFRDLAYIGNDNVWHAISSLTPINGCGAADNNLCSVSAAYGVESVGPNDVIAGSSVSVPEPGQLVWERQAACTLGNTMLTSGSGGDAPLNVTFTDSVESPQGNFRTDWWFGDGSHEAGNSNPTVTYSIPGNYTPLVRVSDSAGCLSEANGDVSVAGANASTFGTATAAVSQFGVGVFTLSAVQPRSTHPPNE